MKQLTEEGVVYELFQSVKERTGSSVTNFFIDQEKLRDWVKSNVFYFVHAEQGVLLFRRDRHFYHLYYYASSLESLAYLINNCLPKEQLVIDVLGKPAQLIPLLQILQHKEFKVINTLARYVRINTPETKFFVHSNEVELAKNSDAEVIAAMFEANFDPLSEQVPSLKEVENLIDQQKILVVKKEEGVKGFLVRSTTGQTSILNNFLVDKMHRGEKIGSKLIKHYIFESQNVKRMILWVIDNNATAISVYQNHGYSADGLLDVILKN